MEQQIPYAFAIKHHILLQSLADDTGRFAYCEDTPSQAMIEACRLLKKPADFQQVDEKTFEELLQEVYNQNHNDTQIMADLIGDDVDLSDIMEQINKTEDLLIKSKDDAPIIRLINALLAEGINKNASDIHIEPYEDRIVIRLRIDGVLQEILQPQRQLAPMLISRIKVMAQLDIAEKRLPQDGRISLRIGGRLVDVRVSTLPTGHGERLVMRLLDKQAEQLDLEHLGMTASDLDAMKLLMNQPHGIILLTGPTGTGKTTTLYSILRVLNDKSRNILTVEDPIEYSLDGIGQTNVNTKIDMSFARGLKAILRQDPDVVMVGEIRDKETAEIAVQASLTGHLVLSSLHTNTAVGAIARLRDIGVEPFLLSSSLIGIIAQRLVRRLCQKCKTQAQASSADKMALGLSEDDTFTIYQKVGCPDCNHTGYKGRIGVYEFIVLDKEIRSMVHDQVKEQKILEQARKRTPGILQSASRLVLQGETTVAEIIRVIREHQGE